MDPLCSNARAGVLDESLNPQTLCSPHPPPVPDQSVSTSEKRTLSALSDRQMLTRSSSLKWRRLEFNRTDAITPRSGHVAAVIGDKMVIFGGHSEPFLSPHIFIVDIGLLILSRAILCLIHTQFKFCDDVAIIESGDTSKPLDVSKLSLLQDFQATYRVGSCGVTLFHRSCLYLFGMVIDVDSMSVHSATDKPLYFVFIDSLKKVDGMGINTQIKVSYSTPNPRDCSLTTQSTKHCLHRGETIHSVKWVQRSCYLADSHRAMMATNCG